MEVEYCASCACPLEYCDVVGCARVAARALERVALDDDATATTTTTTTATRDDDDGAERDDDGDDDAVRGDARKVVEVSTPDGTIAGGNAARVRRRRRVERVRDR